MGATRRSVTGLTGPGRAINRDAVERGIREHARHHENVLAVDSLGREAIGAERRTTVRLALGLLLLGVTALALAVLPV